MIVAALILVMMAAVALPLAWRMTAIRPPVRVRRPDCGPGRRLRWRSDRNPIADDVEVATWCEQVASALRSGDSLTRAVLATDGAWTGAPVMTTVALAIRRGRSLPDALDEVPADPSTAVGLAAGVLRTCALLGGPAASAVGRVATTLQARATERAERRAASAQARLSARVLTFVPFAVLAFLATTDQSVRAALLSPAGLTCLIVGGGLNLSGWWWMRRLIGGAS